MATIKCALCGVKLKKITVEGVGGVQFKDGVLCWSCFEPSGLPIPGGGLSCKHDPVSRALKAIEEKNLARLNEYKQIVFRAKLFGSDDTITFFPNRGYVDILERKRVDRYQIDYILEFEVLENGYSLTKGGLGMAVVGGLLFGGTGAIVGSVIGGKKSNEVVSSLQLKLTFKDAKSPIRYLEFLGYESRKNESGYKTAMERLAEVIALLKVMFEQHARSVEKSNQDRTQVARGATHQFCADELIKLKSLLDQGVITKSEFAQQKKKLLQ